MNANTTKRLESNLELASDIFKTVAAGILEGQLDLLEASEIRKCGNGLIREAVTTMILNAPVKSKKKK